MGSREEKPQLTEFHAEKLYEKEIEPLIAEIKKVCKINNVPFIIGCAVSNGYVNGKPKTVYKYDGVLTGSNHIILHDDRFERMLLLIRGAQLAKIGEGPVDEYDNDYIFSPPDDLDPEVELDEEEHPDEEITDISEYLPPDDDQSGDAPEDQPGTPNGTDSGDGGITPSCGDNILILGDL